MGSPPIVQSKNNNEFRGDAPGPLPDAISRASGPSDGRNPKEFGGEIQASPEAAASWQALTNDVEPLIILLIMVFNINKE